MKKYFTLLFLFILTNLCYAQDIRLNINSDVYTITKNRQWNQFNQTYIFRPKVPQISLYIFVANRNPTNSHTLTLKVYQTPDSTLNNFSSSSGFWVEDAINGDCNNVSANTMTACYVNTMFAGQITIQITNAASAAGSPDTGDIYIIQAVGEPKGQQAGATQTVITNPFETAILNGKAFLASEDVIWTGASNIRFGIFNPSTSGRNIIIERIELNIDTAPSNSSILISKITNIGVGCNVMDTVFLHNFSDRGFSSSNPTAIMSPCTTFPSISTYLGKISYTTHSNINLEKLKNLKIPPNLGIGITGNTAASGIHTATIVWYEE